MQIGKRSIMREDHVRREVCEHSSCVSALPRSPAAALLDCRTELVWVSEIIVRAVDEEVWKGIGIARFIEN